MLTIISRALSLLIFFVLFYYWYSAGKLAQKEKPKTNPDGNFIHALRRITNWLSLCLICVQLLGWQVLAIPIPYMFLSQLVGIGVLISGFFICVLARKRLGSNWVSGYEYQIKHGQTLVTSGIYAYIRHPIYIGLFLIYIGAELVAQSLLWISFLVMMLPLYLQAKREEKLLIKHFGEAYTHYQKRTKMFIPFIW